MNVAPSVFRVGASPEISPERTGSDRGTDALSVYPERDSNPHGREGHKILSRASGRSEPRQIASARGKIEEGNGDERAEMRPNGDRHSPDMSPDILARIREKVAFSPTGCWLWQGAKNTKGYPCLRIGGRAGRTVTVHRLMAEAQYGPIPSGMLACHHCDTPACVNPAHLYIGSPSDNMRDKIERGRAVNPLAEWNASKTHCPQGHPYSDANTLHRKAGDRVCRICNRANNRRAAAKRQQRGAA